jgi:Sulfotransferase domain
MHMTNSPDQPPFGAIFGTGRSGTTWLGAIVDSHQDVLYRFEPFHRAKSNQQLQQHWAKVKAGTANNQDLHTIAQVLRKPNPHLERPPFFPKRSGILKGKVSLNRISNKIPPLKPLYNTLYRSPKAARLVFKEVSMEAELRNLASSGAVPIIYIIRHPAACVASMLKGISTGTMPDGRAKAALELARDRSPSLYERFADRKDDLTLEERLALVWCADTDWALEACEQADSVHFVVYENLCRSTREEVIKVFDHLGLSFDPQTQAFIQAATQETHHERGVNPYFSVYRNPLKAMNSWKTALSPDQINKVHHICQFSKANQRFADCWDWNA